MFLEQRFWYTTNLKYFHFCQFRVEKTHSEYQQLVVNKMSLVMKS
jgi:hypothetical protein